MVNKCSSARSLLRGGLDSPIKRSKKLCQDQGFLTLNNIKLNMKLMEDENP